MKTLFLTLATSIATGLALHYATRIALVSLIWLFDYELTTDQRIFVMENGYLAFVVGMTAGMVVFWRVFRRKV
jgi:hypothetical protein|tara:strand:+ start:1127 stop:1345 length:219 start_codon:yes stop_codon:yes gene_type:complete